MNWSLFARFIFLLWTLSCSDPVVEQIPVKIPDGLTIPPEMAYIPEGEFIMGDPDEPTTLGGKKVFMRAFLIDRFETNREKYNTFQPNHQYNPNKKNFPVTHVNYIEAEAYCHSRGKRLPTEAEWEKAARGIDGRKWPWRIYHEHPNNGFSGFIPEPIKKRKKWISPYGLYGMGHNIWEWTSDWYDYKGMQKLNQRRFKVIRGGLTQTHLRINFSPTWFRNFMMPDEKLNFIGFRCAKEPES
tara:strand:+ start:646 stop:1371 length:726 start_codon:yes stop_codon:yes gene_type:complete